ncbi:cell wall-active antibiotics response protein LiaF [Enterococcus camelliae]
MMKNAWRFFLIGECLLFVFALWQLVHNIPLVILFFLGVGSIFIVTKKENEKKRTLQVIGAIFIVIALVNNFAIWLMLLFAILFIGIKGVEISGVQLFQKNWLKKKKIMMVETIEPTAHASEKIKKTWIGDSRIGSEIFEWNDIVLSIVAGDTIIDLGNTLLPKKENTIVIRKLFGKTRILVPAGIGIKLQQNSFLGTVTFEDEAIQLKNEELIIYSTDYDDSQRKLHILSTNCVGEIEVIRV